MKKLLFVLLAVVCCAWPGWAQPEVKSFALDNGARVLVVPRGEGPMVAAGWVAGVGSGDEIPGKTGISHLLEHLMFRGSQTIGTRDWSREASLLEEREQLESQMRMASEPRRSLELRRKIDEAEARLRQVRFLGEYDLKLTQAGAVGTNALTRRDLTMYYTRIPASRLELWFWLESDRLLEPVFRGLYSEYEVVEQERSQRIDSTAIGRELAEFDERFWQHRFGRDHPYSWPVVGRADDLRTIRTADLARFYRQNYVPSNLTFVIVGDVDVDRIKSWSELYFGRLGGMAPSSFRGLSPLSTDTTALRIERACDCQTRAELRVATVPFGDSAAAALEVLERVLNGRNGRLQRSLVIEQGLAFGAWSVSETLRRGGTFSLVAEARGAVTAAALEQALWTQIETVAEQGISERELQKAKNQVAADAYRELKEPASMMARLLLGAGLGDWRVLLQWPEQVRRVEASEVQEVAQRYFRDDRVDRLLLQRRSRDDASVGLDAER